MFRLGWALCVPLLWPWSIAAAEGAIRIVAAENFYGDVAVQLAGPGAQVVSVLRNPNADPHLFEADTATARAISAADLVIYNGLNYDPWMVKLLASARSSRRRVIEAAAVLHRDVPGTNPHLWYDPMSMPAVARATAAELQQIDPPHQSLYAQRLQQFLASGGQIDAAIDRLRDHYAGTLVAATEPVAQYMTAAIGLVMSNQRFQLAVMNDTEPSASDTAAFEQALRSRKTRVLIYNKQVINPAVQRLVAIARESHVPLVAVTETEPPGMNYQQWMLGQLQALERALAGEPP